MKNTLKTKLILFSILLLAACFRFYGLNWDQGFHLHPDERAIILAVTDLEFPASIQEFLSPESSWNPKFFAYGSFPMYLLKFAGDFAGIFNPTFAEYTNINLVGRFISALSDLIVVLLIFKLGQKLFNTHVGLLASFFYSISVLPVQLSHFYAVDTLLNLFMIATIYSLLNFYEKLTLKTASLTGIFWGLALAVKISASILTAPLIATFALIAIKKNYRQLIKPAIIIVVTAALTFLLLQPYAIIDAQTFIKHTREQSLLTYDPFYFPFTLQYVDKTPYIYELKNIFFWGLGPILATVAFTGTGFFVYQTFGNKKLKKVKKQNLIILSFFLSYFLLVGNFAVGFMRYILPLYPFFALFAAVVFYTLQQILKSKLKNKIILTTLYLILYTILLVWPVSFIQIYNEKNTRVQASDWIYENISDDKTLAVEHWDDQLPLGVSPYTTEVLELYNPDTDEKWIEINSQLSKTDYIIIASGRLYEPLTELTDCRELPAHRCYKKAAKYYDDLFSGKLDFKKVADFTNYPSVPFLDVTINDESSDESFTVYDHPQVFIFKKVRQM